MTILYPFYACSRSFARSFSPGFIEDKEVTKLEGLKHEIFMEREADRKRVFELVIDFIERRF